MAKGRRANGGGSIYPNSKGGYTAQFRVGKDDNGKTIFKRKSFKTKRECEAWLDEMKKKYNGLSLTEFSQLSIAELAQKWFDYKGRKLKPKSLDRIESTMNTHILPAIGDYKLCDVTPEIIQKKIFDKMVGEKNLSKSSVKKAYDDLNNFFNYCINNDWLDKSPMRRVTIQGYDFKEEKEVKSFTADEMDKIIASSLEEYKNGKPIYECGTVFPIAYYTGMRIAEVLGLRWKNVNLVDGYVDVVETVVTAKDRSTDSNSRTQIVQQGGKTKSSRRRIPLNQTALRYFELQKSRRYYGEDYFVFNIKRKEFRTMTESNVRRSLENILENNGIEHTYIIHSLRHTFATNLKERGIDELIIARLLGHSNSDVTQRYIDTRFDELRKAVRTLD